MFEMCESRERESSSEKLSEEMVGENREEMRENESKREYNQTKVKKR